MTEIPEHLLKRSQAAKAKATGEAPAEAPAASAPAAAPAGTGESTAVAPAAAAAAPAKPAAPVGPPPPKPDSPVVAAAKARKRIPFWAMATLSLLPLWAFMYARGLTPKEHVVAGPLGEGATIYTSNCSSCHGANGEGGLGYEFAAGEVQKTFPHIEDQLRFVYNGTQRYEQAGIPIYGNPDREGGPHVAHARGIMPQQGLEAGGGLTDAQILAVVCHERFDLGLGGEAPTGADLEEFEKWCSPEAPAWVGLESGELTFENIADELDGTLPVGIEPAAGSPPAAET
ncbi:MAG: c-type cytochrome [Ilumatobacteraceae bacterium]